MESVLKPEGTESWVWTKKGITASVGRGTEGCWTGRDRLAHLHAQVSTRQPGRQVGVGQRDAG